MKSNKSESQVGRITKLVGNIAKSLKKYFEVGQFDSENKYKCDECGKKTKAQFYSQLCYTPEVLVFHIKRFDLSGRKISKFCEYPLEIDMSKY